MNDKEARMNKSRLIGGIICIVLAGLLTILTIKLPENKMMFLVGDENFPYVPVIILGVIGIVLLASVGKGKKEEPKETTQEAPINPEKAALNNRLEIIGWGLFLIMLGGFIFIPYEYINKGIWSLGVGIIMLGLNITRYFYNIKMSTFTTFLGIISLISGIAQLLGVNMLEGGILLIILGAYVLLKPWFEKQPLFGKAEEA
jgi:hypothetical protein